VQVEWQGGKMVEVPGTEKEYKADLVLLAMGFVARWPAVLDAFGVDKDTAAMPRPAPTAAGGYKTNVDKVFAAGDMRRGQSWWCGPSAKAGRPRARSTLPDGGSTLPR
jgi:glutamate synthase (NADPH/NADH) small chain